MSASEQEACVRLLAILTAQIKMPRGYAFRAQGNPFSKLRAALIAGEDALLAPCLAFAVEHPSAGTILIDTGFHQDAQSNPRKDFGLPLSLMFRGMRPVEKPFDEQLRELGIEPERVESVVMTHLHLDHTSGMRLLPNARFTCSAAEWAATRTSFPARHGYVPHHLPAEHRMHLVDLTSDGEAFGPFERTLDLLGDGSMRLIYTPGHTKGHLSVLLRTDEQPQVLLVGDAAYILRNIAEGVLPFLTDDDGESIRSLHALEAFAQENPTAILVPSHDPEAWRELSGSL
jgi:N-acyl homoserine lactone hydrolase